MKDCPIEQHSRRGLLMMAAAAGVSLATPRMLRAAGRVDSSKAATKFGGDLATVRAAIEKQQGDALNLLSAHLGRDFGAIIAGGAVG